MRRIGIVSASCIALALLVGTAGQAHAYSLPDRLPSFDLLFDADVRIFGVPGNPYAPSGIPIASAGDVNGDGLDDVIIGAPYADHNGRNNSGSAYIIFGDPDIDAVDLADFELQCRDGDCIDTGFRIDGAVGGNLIGDSAGASVAGAGDVNGDGLDDVVVGAPDTDIHGTRSGSAYIVFGKSGDTNHVDLGEFDNAGNTAGYRVDGADSFNYAGTGVAGAGDVNNDSIPDAIVGVTGAGNGTGSVFVVFGKSGDTDVINLADLDGSGSSAGYRVGGNDSNYTTGRSVSNAGDVNGDRIPDMIIGSYGADNSRGSVFVVFGKSSDTPVDLNTLADQGFRIDGVAAGDYTGFSVSGANDMNDDGLADLLIGAPFTDSGAAYLIYGRRSVKPIDLNALGDQGTRIDGAAAGDFVGWSVAGVGDVSGGDRPDLAIGAYHTDSNGRTGSGSAYVVHGIGERPAPSFNPSNISSGVFRIDGAAERDYAGYQVAGAGDFNGDGCSDIIVGARGALSAYIIYGCSGPDVARDPACDRRNNRFGVFDFDVDTPDSHVEQELSKVTSEFLACGTKLTSASSYSWAGSGSQFVRFQIDMPPGALVNTDFSRPSGLIVGSINFDVLTWREGPWDPALFTDVSMHLRVVRLDEPDCPSEALTCYRGNYGGDGYLMGHNMNWVTENNGRYTLTIGEFHRFDEPSIPVGITKINELVLCRYPGEFWSIRCGYNFEWWHMRNGDASTSPGGRPCTYPDSSGRRRRGIYTVSATTRNGRKTKRAKACVTWYSAARGLRGKDK